MNSVHIQPGDVRGAARASRRLTQASRALALSALVVAVEPVAGQTLVSINRSADGAGNGASTFVVTEKLDYRNRLVSADGRYVVFTSRARNLDTTYVDIPIRDLNDGRRRLCVGFGCPEDIYVRDLQANRTTLITINADGDDTGGGSEYFANAPSISADGRFVTYVARTSDLVAGGTNNATGIFVTDRDRDGDGIFDERDETDADGDGNFNEPHPFATALLSIRPDGTAPTAGFSFSAVMNSTGRYVGFISDASDLVAGDTNGEVDVFFRDRDRDEDGIFDEPDPDATLLVSRTPANTSGNGDSRELVLSSDGAWVAFVSEASDLVANDVNGTRDVFLWEAATGNVHLVSATPSGTSGNGPSEAPSLSADGRFVAFRSDASNLTDGDDNGARDIFVWDRLTGATSLISVNAAGNASGDGPSGGAVGAPLLDATGRHVVFASRARDLVANDSNGAEDVFVRDRDVDGNGIFDEAGFARTVLISENAAGTGSGNRRSGNPVVSSDGRYIGFTSLANDLVATDSGRQQDVFLRDRDADGNGVFDEPGDGVTLLASGSSRSGNRASASPALSADGGTLAFESRADDLVPIDTNGAVRDVFVLQTPPP